MSRRASPSTGRVYSLQRVVRLWGLSRATVYRQRHPAKVVERKRPGPRGPMSDDDLVAAIRQLLTCSPFDGPKLHLHRYRQLCLLARYDVPEVDCHFGKAFAPLQSARGLLIARS